MHRYYKLYNLSSIDTFINYFGIDLELKKTANCIPSKCYMYYINYLINYIVKLSYAKHLAYFLRSKKLAKLITNVTGRLFQLYVCLSVAQYCIRLFKRTIKASDLPPAAKCRH